MLILISTVICNVFYEKLKTLSNSLLIKRIFFSENFQIDKLNLTVCLKHFRFKDNEILGYSCWDESNKRNFYPFSNLI